MTVSSTTARLIQYNGNGATTAFSTVFKFIDEDDLVVTLTSSAGVDSTPTYTVTGGSGAIGTVTLSVAPASGETLTIRSATQILQPVDYVENTPFPANTQEQALDKLTYICQDLSEQVGRAIIFKDTSGISDINFPAPAALEVLRWNAAADTLETASITDFGTVALPASNGIVISDGTDNLIGRTLTGTASEVTVTNGTGVSGNPTISLPFPAAVKTFLNTATSANLLAAVSDETGTGSLVFGTAPTISAPKINQINDTNANELLKFTSTASAVNEITITNTTTGNSPIISATGDDANIAVLLQSKGTGKVGFLGNSTQAAGLTLYEDTDNGTNYVTIDAPSAITANRLVQLPDTDISCFVVQRQSSGTGGVSTGTTILPIDNSIPQNTEGDQYLSVSITPKNSNNILKIDVTIILASSVGSTNSVAAALFQDSTASALAAAFGGVGVNNAPHTITFSHTMVAGTTSSTTFKVRGGAGGAGTTTFNGSAGAGLFNGTCASRITVTEFSS